MVCLFQAPTVVRLVVESPLVGHMQGYHCIQHHIERTVCWRPFVQELLMETEPSSGMWDSLFICCFLPSTFSQELIGRILGVGIWDEVSNKRKGTRSEIHWDSGSCFPGQLQCWPLGRLCLHPATDFTLILNVCSWNNSLLSNCLGTKSYLICVWEFSIACSLPSR